MDIFGSILNVIFSKFGGVLAAVAGVAFILWRQRIAEEKKRKAEAALVGITFTQEAAEANRQIDKEAQIEKQEIDQEQATGNLEALRDRFNTGEPDPPDPGMPSEPPADQVKPRATRRPSRAGKTRSGN